MTVAEAGTHTNSELDLDVTPENPEQITDERKNLERFMFLLSGIDDGIWDWDLGTGEFWFSDRSVQMLGYEIGELPAAFNTIIDLVHPDDLGEMLEVWSEYMEGQIPKYTLQYRLRKKDGSYLWTEARGISARHPGEEEPYRLSGYHSDITVRKEQEQIISEKTADIHNMLHNMLQGVFTVMEGNKIHAEYSSYLEVILGTAHIGGRDVVELLFADSNLGSDTVNQVETALSAMIGEDSLGYEMNSHLLVDEIIKDCGDEKAILQIEWVPIANQQDIIEKILVIVQNVTEVRKLALEAKAQQEELDIIGQILKISMEKFNEFIDSAYRYIDENRAILKKAEHKDSELINALFRNMHTIKGNARTYEFVSLTSTIHDVEQHYDQLRKDPNSDWDRDQLLLELQVARSAIERYEQINITKLGRKGRSSDLLTSRGTFIANQALEALQGLTQQLAETSPHPLLDEMQSILQKVGQISLSRVVSGAMDSVFSIAKELGKAPPILDLQDHDASVSHKVAEPLKSSFMHIVRNCIDHGIEGADEREALGKSAAGTIRCSVAEVDDRLEICIADDGRGLALHKLYAKARSNDIFTENAQPAAQQVADLIFHSGLSTADEVTMVSGRGVGMEAVQVFLQKQGGSIEVRLKQTPEPGMPFDFVPFEFVIALPKGSYCIA